MIKTIAIAAVATFGLPSMASAFVHHHNHAAHHYHMLHHGTQHHGVHADGYCNGVADGSGLSHHCGTATGGVPGGIPGHS